MLRVALVTSVGRCGIAEHSRMLMAGVAAADLGIEFSTNPEWLNPQVGPEPYGWDVIHLNYHRGLHSQWTPQVIAQKFAGQGTPVVITFHDTYERQPDALPWDLLATENVRAMIVHEHCDLSGATEHYSNQLGKVHFWRQPCPSLVGRGWSMPIPSRFSEFGWRPTLGTLGFDFPWKNYSMLAKVTGELGWNLRIVGQVEPDRQGELVKLNRNIYFDGYVTDTSQAVATLSSCDATAFIYTCGNSGTSGAIRVGMTAGKPLIAAQGCRQFRDLEGMPDAWPINWVAPTEEGLRSALQCLVARRAGPQGYNLGLIGLSQQESWERHGERYAALYREVAAARG